MFFVMFSHLLDLQGLAIIHLCVCYRPLVCVVCPNHEVMVFQPQTVTATDLWSIANIITIIAILPQLFQPCY